MNPIRLQLLTESSVIEQGRRLLLKCESATVVPLRHPFAIGRLEIHAGRRIFTNDFSKSRIRNVTHWGYLDD